MYVQFDSQQNVILRNGCFLWDSIYSDMVRYLLLYLYKMFKQF